MTDTPLLSRFTPSRTSPEILERIFVQREGLAKDTADRIVDSATNGGKHQLLFVGPRGSGKTHFVSLLFHRLQAREDLRDRLRIAWLAEDETTTTFFKLLLRIYHALQQRYSGEFPAPDTLMLGSMDVEARIRWLTRTLVEKLSGRTLLVIVENLDERFKDLGDEGQKRWRAFLQEHVVTTTLATSQQLFEGVSRRVSPFFGFFQVEHLKPLEFDDAVLLLTKIAEEVKHDKELVTFLRSPTGRSRVRALFHLSGGNHRIYVVLSEFITRESLDELVGPFERMLDELTPYYQVRLDWLSSQQREIVEFLARAKYAVPVKEIVAKLFLPHQTVTAQLKELKDKGYVLSNQVGRESRYELTEPLLRLCVQVKDNHPQSVRLLVDFLRLWYSREHLEQRLRNMPSLVCVERQYIEESLSTMDDNEEGPVVRSLMSDLRVQRQEGDPDVTVPILEELSDDLWHLKWMWSVLLAAMKDRTLRKERLERLVSRVADAGALNFLGHELVCTLEFLRSDGIDSETLRDWHELWKEVGQGYEALQLPIRLFEVGIRYRKTGERKVLRDLVSEERRIVEEALGLGPTDDPRTSG